MTTKFKVLALLVSVFITCQSFKTETFKELVSLKDYLISGTDDGFEVIDDMSCARICGRDEACASACFTPSDKKCHILSRWIFLADSASRSIGATYYIKIRQCAPGYSFVEGTSSCLKVKLHAYTFSQAVGDCRVDGGDLLTLKTLEKHGHVRDFVNAKGLLNHHYWLGATYQEGDGIWTWSDGSQMDNAMWCPAEPNGLMIGEHALEIRNEFQCVNDQSPAYLLYYICEAPVVLGW